MQGKMEALRTILEKLKALDADEVRMSIKRQPEDMYGKEMNDGMGYGKMGEEEEKEDEGIEISPEALAILSKLKK
jgi:hypothetical protein